MPQYTNSGMQGMPQQQQRVPQQQQMPVQQMPPQPYSNMPHQQQQQPHRQMPSPADPQQLQRSHSSGGLMTPGMQCSSSKIGSQHALQQPCCSD